jgi:type IV secretion system protein VirB2
MKIQLFAGNSTESAQSTRALLNSYFKIVVIAMLLMPCIAFADNEACTSVVTSMTTVQSLLKAISVIVITIAVIFAGYQIAFAHKRISEVAPVLIGAVLIGAAATIATMFITTSSC